PQPPRQDLYFRSVRLTGELTEGPLAASLACLTQATPQVASGEPVAMHVPIDRHVTDPGDAVQRQPACNLFGTPLGVGQERFDASVGIGIVLPDLPASPAPAI